MNLTNLFNYKYFLQNMKKSKGLMILILTLVPMLTSIIIISVGRNEIFSFAELGIINILCMYILPIVLSMCLFNFIYKKNSVDFMVSMPLSRKTIFLTNTIGGIGIIALMQLITAIATFLLSKIISSVTIFGGMIWDVFVFFTFAYIFVFTVSNLAMTFSGNKFSQIATILLILFLVPFLVITTTIYSDLNSSYDTYSSYIYETNEQDQAQISFVDLNNFTAPSYFTDLLFGGSYEYNSTVVLKMAVLSVVYIIIGVLLFDKKKFEMAGESFENEKVHLIVKGLTFVPFFALFCALDEESKVTAGLFFIAILAIYYFVFDLITNKKIKIRKSILSFVASAFIVFCFYEGLAGKIGALNIRRVLVDDVKAVTIDSIGSGYNRRFNFGLKIEDKDLIEKILLKGNGIYYNADSFGDARIFYSESTDRSYEMTTTIPAADVTTTIPVADATTVTPIKYKGETLSMELELNNGKKYRYTDYINADIIDGIINYASDKKVEKVYKNAIPEVLQLTLTKEQKEKIIEIVNEEINITYKELFDKYSKEYTPRYLDLYEYENHKLVKNSFSTKGFTDLNTYIINIVNKFTVKNINKIVRIRLEDYEKLMDYIEYKNPELFKEFEEYEEGYNTTEGLELLDNIKWGSIIDQEVYRDFIKQDANNEFDIEKDYASFYCSNYNSYYYTNDIEGLYKAIAKEINQTGMYKLNEE